MTERNSLTTALLLCAMLLAPCLKAAQQAPAAAPATAAEEDSQSEEQDSGSREVEISEDNYRRFMELDDQPIERAMPIMQAPSQAGLENMQRLPEPSQKHLRDQLREIILGSGSWTPASMNKDYPFVPSEAAQSDASLRQLEAAAWQELVAQYHAREAEIQAARQPGSASAAAQAAATGGQSGADAGQNANGQAAGQQGQAGAEGQQAGGQQAQDSSAQASEQARRQQQSQASSSSSRGQSQYRPPPEGSEQSALEFLTGQAAGSSTRPGGTTVNRQPAGRLSLEQLERVQGINRVSTDPTVPAEDPAEAEQEDDEPAAGSGRDEG